MNRVAIDRWTRAAAIDRLPRAPCSVWWSWWRPAARPRVPRRQATARPASRRPPPRRPRRSASAAPRESLRTALHDGWRDDGHGLAGAEQGGFAEEGLDAELTFIGAGQAILGALSSQETPIVIAGANQVVEANLQGGEYVILGSAMPYLTTSVFVLPEDRAPRRPARQGHRRLQLRRDLARRREGCAGVLGPRGRPRGHGRALRRHARDVRRHAGRRHRRRGVRRAAVVPGARPGLPRADRRRDPTLEMGTASVISTRRYVAEHPDLVERYLKALMRGIQAFKTQRDVDRRRHHALWPHGRPRAGGEDLGVLPRQDRRRRRHVAARLENNLSLRRTTAEARDARVEQFLDSSFVERIKASGYVEQVKQGKSAP